MPPHCDSMDGPVVTAARKALEVGDVQIILPYVPKEGEAEVTEAFNRVLPLHRQNHRAREIADQFFFETVVRIHRAGEGASFTGLKPAGLDVGPVIPLAEKAIETESVDELVNFLCNHVHTAVVERFEQMKHLKHHAHESVDAARAYVEAMLDLQVSSHQIFLCTKAHPHKNSHNHGH